MTGTAAAGGSHGKCWPYIIAVIASAVATVLSKEEPYATDYIVGSFLIAAVFGLVALVIGVWLFVQIGFLKGTQGPNRFGQDPLGAARDAALGPTPSDPR
jgi:uncharacterized membrane protein YhaH (DUF805 family)